MAGLERQTRPVSGPVKERKNGVRQPLQNSETPTTCYAMGAKRPHGARRRPIAEWRSCAAELAVVRQHYAHLLFVAGQEVCRSRRQALVRRLRREQADALVAVRVGVCLRNRAERRTMRDYYEGTIDRFASQNAPRHRKPLLSDPRCGALRPPVSGYPFPE